MVARIRTPPAVKGARRVVAGYSRVLTAVAARLMRPASRVGLETFGRSLAPFWLPSYETYISKSTLTSRDGGI